MKTIREILEELAIKAEDNNPVSLSYRDNLINQALPEIHKIYEGCIPEKTEEDEEMKEYRVLFSWNKCIDLIKQNMDKE